MRARSGLRWGAQVAPAPPSAAIAAPLAMTARTNANDFMSFLLGVAGEGSAELFGAGGIDARAHLRHLVGGKAAASGVLPNEGFVRGDVDAVDLVVGDEALDPLDPGPEVAQHAARGGGDSLPIGCREFPGAGDLAFDDESGHVDLLADLAGGPAVAGQRAEASLTAGAAG